MIIRTCNAWTIALAGFVTLTLTPQARAQAIDATRFPPPITGEFGPQTPVADSLPLSAMVDGDGVDHHTTGEAGLEGDDEGAWRIICNDGQVNGADPIVAPGIEGGAPHPHGWYGNLGGNAKSTYASLRTTGDTTCGSKGNRSAYWRPPIIDPVMKKVIRAKYISLYYKGYPRGSEQCDPNSSRFVGICVPLPSNLKMIYGYDFLTGKAPTGAVRWKCVSPQGISRSEYLASWTEAMEACAAGDEWVNVIDAPSCWDGVRLDSPNHRDHVSYRLPNGKCPSTHPKHFMHLTQITSTVLNANYKQWYLSCDRMPGMQNLAPGTCMHQDYWQAWNERILIAIQRNCIDRMLNCSGGDIGNGYRLKPDQPVLYAAVPPTASIPLIRGGMAHGMVHVGHH